MVYAVHTTTSCPGRQQQWHNSVVTQAKATLTTKTATYRLAASKSYCKSYSFECYNILIEQRLLFIYNLFYLEGRQIIISFYVCVSDK